MNVISTLGGLAGAASLTLLNGAIKLLDKNALQPDLLGQNALARAMKGNDLIPKTAQQYFPLAGDLITNTLYYGMAKGNSPANTMLRGALLGLSAGIGAVTLPKQLGLERPRAKENPDKALMTIAWYVIGGLVAASVINALTSDNKPETKELQKGITNVTREAGKKIAQTV